MALNIGFTSEDLPSGGDLRHRERALNGRFRDVVADLCDMRCADIDHSFDGSLALCVTPEIVVGYLSGLAITCHRGASHIRNDGNDALFVQLNLGLGHIGGRPVGRDYDLAPGQAAFCVHNASVDIRSQAGTGLLGITLPRHLVADWTMAPEDLAGTVVGLDHPALRLLAPYARLFQSQPDAGPGLVAASTRHMAMLIGTGFGALDPRAALDRHGQAVGDARLAGITDLVRRQCAAPDLTAARVGAQLGISERMVQHVLHRAGTSFSQLAGALRAERARALLLDPAFAGVSTADIGFACGFGDVSAFYRSFRRRFDATPGQLREMARNGDF